MSNIDELLNSPELKAPERLVDKIIKRFQFRLFGKLFRFDIIKEKVKAPSMFACDEVLCDTGMMKFIRATPDELRKAAGNTLNNE
jgi:hypothetical protein